MRNGHLRTQPPPPCARCGKRISVRTGTVPGPIAHKCPHGLPCVRPAWSHGALVDCPACEETRNAAASALARAALDLSPKMALAPGCEKSRLVTGPGFASFTPCPKCGVIHR